MEISGRHRRQRDRRALGKLRRDVPREPHVLTYRQSDTPSRNEGIVELLDDSRM